MRPNPLGSHHDHIDGSQAVKDVIMALYGMAGKPFPFESLDAWLVYFNDVHQDIVQRFGTVTSVLQTEEALRLMGYSYVMRRRNEGWIYAEGMFAPQYHVRNLLPREEDRMDPAKMGAAMRKVTDWMVAGIRDGEDRLRAERRPMLGVAPHICIGRETTPEIGVEIAKIAVDYGGELVLDLVCDEAGHPPEKHLPAYELTFGTSVKRDCHASEWVTHLEGDPKEAYWARAARNLSTALFALKCDGVGHAIPLAKYPNMLARVIDKGIRISWCPLSNLKTYADDPKQRYLFNDIRELEIDRLLDLGVLGTLNADDDLFLPPMPEVLDAADGAYNFSQAQCEKLELNVYRGAFVQIPF